MIVAVCHVPQVSEMVRYLLCAERRKTPVRRKGIHNRFPLKTLTNTTVTVDSTYATVTANTALYNIVYREWFSNVTDV